MHAKPNKCGVEGIRACIVYHPRSGPAEGAGSIVSIAVIFQQYGRNFIITELRLRGRRCKGYVGASSGGTVDAVSYTNLTLPTKMPL